MIAVPVSWSQTFMANQQAEFARVQAMDQNEVGKLLNSDPPAFCTVLPAVSATMLINDDDLWNWGKIPLERRIQLEQAYASASRKIHTCMADSIQKSDEPGIGSALLALATLEARYLDLRASFIGDAAVRIEQLSGAVNQMQNLVVALSQTQGTQKQQSGFAQRLGVALQGLGNWAQYQQQLSLYRRYSASIAQNQTSAFQPRPAIDVFKMLRDAQSNTVKAAHPLGDPVHCISRTLLDGTVSTV
jgi:hypothetical protein